MVGFGNFWVADVVTIARRWVGTPYQHQASIEAVGVDCLGLILGIWREFYGTEVADIPAYSPDWGEPCGREVLLPRMRADFQVVPAGSRQLGDILVLRMRARAVAKHLAVLSAKAKIIHAYSGRGVVETPLNTAWERRVVGVFRFPDRRR